MASVYVCPVCNNVTEVPEDAVGTSIPCSHCQHPLPITPPIPGPPAWDQAAPPAPVDLPPFDAQPDFSDGLLDQTYETPQPFSGQIPATMIGEPSPAKRLPTTAALPPAEFLGTPDVPPPGYADAIPAPPPPPPMADILPPSMLPVSNVHLVPLPPEPPPVYTPPAYTPPAYKQPSTEVYPPGSAAPPVYSQPGTEVYPPDTFPPSSGEVFPTAPGPTYPPPPAAGGSRNIIIGLVALLVVAIVAVPLAFWLGRVRPPKDDNGTQLAANNTTTSVAEQPTKKKKKSTVTPPSGQKTTISPVKEQDPVIVEARPLKAKMVLANAILDDLNLKEFKADDQKNLRYFTLLHLYNNPALSAKELEEYRQALQLVVERLSGKTKPLTAADKDQLIFRVDLRDLGWDQKDSWEEILKYYPYGLTLNEKKVKEKGLADAAQQIVKKTGNPIPWVHADWFIVAASRQPLLPLLAAKPEEPAELPEVVKTIIARYQQPVTMNTAASELGLPDAKVLADLFRDKTDANREKRLRSLGLMPLIDNGIMPRDEWTAISPFQATPFQELARELLVGSPYQNR